jgi:hypothetical protein
MFVFVFSAYIKLPPYPPYFSPKSAPKDLDRYGLCPPRWHMLLPIKAKIILFFLAEKRLEKLF